MPNEVTIRIESTPEVEEKISAQSLNEEKLPVIPSSSFWKPVGVPLNEFHPSEKVVRLRTFVDGKSKAERIEIQRLPEGGYTHTNGLIISGSEEECAQKLQDNGYEKWVQFSQESIKYSLPHDLAVLKERFGDISSTLKFEGLDEATIWEFLKSTGITKENVTNLNTAELLAKHLGLI